MSDKSYLVSARKYRPQLFKEVVSQEHVSDTLKNAIRLERLAHAYLFTGPRGVGKTTAARILAKAINCQTPSSEREESAEPCRTCESCVSFEQGRNLNIIEIDAASNNKVDDARDIRETVRIPPQGARMKVYIIDEVHMLTTQAFNALLKTLEEPPPHALFIFATTEPHKVPATIQSRCQRFDFRRIATQEAVDYLRVICETEQVTIDEGSLLLVARKGDGAMRDALSVFDQAISLCGHDIKYDDLVRALGVVDDDLYFDVSDAIYRTDSGTMFRIVEKIVRSGYDIQEFVDGLEEHFRHLLVSQTVGSEGLIDATSEQLERIKKTADVFSHSTIIRLIHLVSQLSDQLRMARQPRLRLELALVKMANLPSSIDLQSALEKLTVLENAVKTGTLPDWQVKPGPEKKRVTETPDHARAQESEYTPESVVARELAPEPDPIPAPPPEPAAKQPGSKQPNREQQAAKQPGSEQPNREQQGPEKPDPEQPLDAPPPRERVRISFGEPALKINRQEKPTGQTTETSAEGANSENGFIPDQDATAGGKSGQRISGAQSVGGTYVSEELTDGVSVIEAPGPDPDAASTRIAELKTAWDQVVDKTMDTQIRLGSLLRHSALLNIRGDHAEIAVPDAFHKRMLMNEKALLAEYLSESYDDIIHDLRFSVRSELFEDFTTTSEADFDSKAFLEKKSEENPAIQKLVERFGGEIVW